MKRDGPGLFFAARHPIEPQRLDAMRRPAGDGTYIAGPFDLFMPGLWEGTVEITGSDGTEDRVVFAFDIEG